MPVLTGEKFPRGQRERLFLIVFLVLSALLALAVLVNPLPTGLEARFYWNSFWQEPALYRTRLSAVDLYRYLHEYPFRTWDISICWRGALRIDRAGRTQFALAGHDYADLAIDGRLVVALPEKEGGRKSAEIELARGFHAIEVRYANSRSEPQLAVTWHAAGGMVEPLARAPLFARMPAHRFDTSIARLRRLLWPLLLAAWILLLSAWLFFGAGARPVAVLLGFFLLGSIGLNLVLGWLIDGSRFHDETTLSKTAYFLTRPMHTQNDSWGPMAAAFQYLREHPRDRQLYQHIFFGKHIKFQYPPTSLLFFLPLMGIPDASLAPTANLVSWLLILISTLVLARVLALALRRFARSDLLAAGKIGGASLWLIAACFTSTFYPLMRSFQIGQIQTWLYFLFLLAIWAWLAGKKAAAGVAVGLIAIVKPQLILFLAWGLLRRQWRFSVGLAAIVGSAMALSLALFGFGCHWEYLKVLAYMNRYGESFFTNQSLHGLLHRLLGSGSNLHGNPFAFAPYSAVAYWASLLFTAGLVAVALFLAPCRRGRGERAETLDFMAAATAFTLASPIVWEHHYVVLLPLFLVVLVLGCDRPRRLAWLGLVYLLCATHWQVANILAYTPFNFLQSPLFFGALIFFVLLYRLRLDEDRGDIKIDHDRVSEKKRQIPGA